MLMEDKKDKYYDSSAIDALDATYNLIYGQRSNGKTWRCCRKIVDAYLDEGLPSAYVRRLEEMIRPANLKELFSPHIDYIREKTSGAWNGIVYRTHGFYLCLYDEDGEKIKQDVKPFCRTYSINTAETTKGQDAGAIKYVVFDEFMTRQYYLVNEFVLWQNLISSLIRTHEGVKLYLLGNTVSKYCPYFSEMGLTRAKQQKQGTIDVYTMGNTKSLIAVEYCKQYEVSQKMQTYYCFDNPQLNMITSGAWEIPMYRHIPDGIGRLYPELEFYIEFDGQTERGAIYIKNDAPLLTFSRRYKEIKDPEEKIIFSDCRTDPNPLHQEELAPVTNAHKVIIDLIRQHKTYFATNEDGEFLANWLKATEGGLTI